jgi:hypothetical protein
MRQGVARCHMNITVMPRESGVSSTPQLFGFAGGIPDRPLSRAMTSISVDLLAAARRR